MDGFPNGRRLEDDVTRIELQAVGGVVLAAIGLWYDDYKLGGSPLTPQLINVLSYNTGVDKNDTTLRAHFPYVQTPWAGTHICDCGTAVGNHRVTMGSSSTVVYQGLAIGAPEVVATTSPNPFIGNNTVKYRLDAAAKVKIEVFNETGNLVKVLLDKNLDPGIYTQNWNSTGMLKGVYFIHISKNGITKQNLRVVKG